MSEHNDLLIGRTIVGHRYLTHAEAEGLGWGERWQRHAAAIVLDNGTLIVPSQDEEGNGPGEIFVEVKGGPTYVVFPPMPEKS